MNYSKRSFVRTAQGVLDRLLYLVWLLDWCRLSLWCRGCGLSGRDYRLLLGRRLWRRSLDWLRLLKYWLWHWLLLDGRRLWLNRSGLRWCSLLLGLEHVGKVIRLLAGLWLRSCGNLLGLLLLWHHVAKVVRDYRVHNWRKLIGRRRWHKIALWHYWPPVICCQACMACC